ncbi:MAG TPA: hypothetical protein VM031_05030 [Phycisphaerae bacterium]|nr:hypothetical protein [Phycisphaerae bacterium]
MEPIYTAENCRFAYQLRWALALFWREPALWDTWLQVLAPAAEQDGVRILRHDQAEPNVSRFLLSTRAGV